MGLFRRKESLNARLLREGGLGSETAADERPAQPFDPFAERFVDADTRAMTPRARQWDALVTVDVPELEGDAVEFTAIDAENVLVDEEQGDADLSPLAEAVEQQLEPPYRARAVRRHGTLWAVSANRIQVARFAAGGDRIELATHGGERTAAVDGEPTMQSFPALQRLGEEAGPDYAVHAERLDGDAWEVRVSRL